MDGARLSRRLAMLAALPCAGCFSAYIAGQGAYVSELPLADAPARAGGEGVLYGGIGVARRDSAGGFGGNVRVRVTDGVGGGDGGIHAYGIEPIAAFGRDEPNGSLSAWGRAAAWVGGSGYGFRWSHTLEGGLLFCPDAHTTTPVAVGNVRLGMRHDTSGLCATLGGLAELDLVAPGPSTAVFGVTFAVGVFSF